jgi:8-oxo-dGTP pyrophosphatase MutT (NUDIX family)
MKNKRRPLESAGVLIYHPTKEDYVLGVTRGIFSTKWGLPGGKIEDGEYAIYAAVRELYEETGIMLSTLDLLQKPYVSHVAYRERSHFYKCRVPVKFRGIRLKKEGWVAWVPVSWVNNGPFGAYNKRLMAFFDGDGTI